MLIWKRDWRIQKPFNVIKRIILFLFIRFTANIKKTYFTTPVHQASALSNQLLNLINRQVLRGNPMRKAQNYKYCNTCKTNDHKPFRSRLRRASPAAGADVSENPIGAPPPPAAAPRAAWSGWSGPGWNVAPCVRPATIYIIYRRNLSLRPLLTDGYAPLRLD